VKKINASINFISSVGRCGGFLEAGLSLKVSFVDRLCQEDGQVWKYDFVQDKNRPLL